MLGKSLKILALTIASVVVVAIAALLAFTPVADRRNIDRFNRGDFGYIFWLKGDNFSSFGDRNTGPVTDWSFTDAVEVVQLETRTPYLIPHSVNLEIARVNQRLYLFSAYAAPAPGERDIRDRFPEGRFWNRMVVRDPRVRLKIFNRLFEMRAYHVTDSGEAELARQAFTSKYANLVDLQSRPEAQRPRVHFFRLEPR
jgi:hypothetical protein